MKQSLLIYFVTASMVSHAQPTPLFSMPIWFEDTLGNKDTVWVGVDTAASSYFINPQFGEVAITTPFDSVFEVRGVHSDDWTWQTSKTIIEPATSGLGCLLPGRTRLMIHALHLPVTVRWDTIRILELAPCHENILLTPTNLPFLLPNWYEGEILFCMMPVDSVILDFNYTISEPASLLKHAFQVQGQGMLELNGLYYTGFYDYSYCYTLLGTKSPVEATFDVLRLGPNPASGAGAVLLSQRPERVKEVVVFKIGGDNVARLCEPLPDGSWSTGILEDGVHIVSVTYDDGSRAVRKLVVVINN
jgi:hypothetical protein